MSWSVSLSILEEVVLIFALLSNNLANIIWTIISLLDFIFLGILIHISGVLFLTPWSVLLTSRLIVE